MAHHSIYNLAAFIGCLLFLNFPLRAYILPGSWIVEQMAKNCLNQSTKLKGILSTNSNFKDDFFMELGLSKKGLEIDKITPVNPRARPEAAKQTLFPLYVLDILHQCSDQPQPSLPIKKYLSDLKIDMNKVSLAFFANDIVYIIGADPQDESLPQLWVDKYSFFPLREKTLNYDVTFDKWLNLPRASGKFPHEITVTKNGSKRRLSLAEKL